MCLCGGSGSIDERSSAISPARLRQKEQRPNPLRGMLREHGLSTHRVSEAEVVRRWWTLQPGVQLPLSSGTFYYLLFAGRPGGGAGPDVRDVVLLGPEGQQVGDVELHVRASDWYAHRHQSDARYNQVILHVVLVVDHSRPPQRQDGVTIPVCSLADVSAPNAEGNSSLAGPASLEERWPCHRLWPSATEHDRSRLLQIAGQLRFEAHAEAFVEILRRAEAHGAFSAYDVCLIPALAEALGYGRNRAFFRACGLQLLGLPAAIPEPPGRAAEPAALDVTRLHILQALVERWRKVGAWTALHINRL
jgi:hypothetical protein